MRGKQATRRKTKPDIKYSSVLVSKFITYLMRRGKKSTAQRIVYTCFDLIDEKIKKGQIKPEFKTAIDVFDGAIRNISPVLEVRGRRIGGGNYQIPFPVKGDRKMALAFRWLITAAKKKKGKTMAQKLSEELIDALNETGEAYKKKLDVHKMAEANRAFAHFAR